MAPFAKLLLPNKPFLPRVFRFKKMKKLHERNEQCYVSCAKKFISKLYIKGSRTPSLTTLSRLFIGPSTIISLFIYVYNRTVEPVLLSGRIPDIMGLVTSPYFTITCPSIDLFQMDIENKTKRKFV